MEKFDAVIKKVEGIDGAFVEIPFDVEKVFGAKRVKVNASFDGLSYKGSIVRMGGMYLIGLTQDIRKKIGKQPGDSVRIEIEKDEAERQVEIPEDFGRAMDQHPEAGAFFGKLSFTKKKDYVQWILDAKREETRISRINKALELLREGKALR